MMGKMEIVIHREGTKAQRIGFYYSVFAMHSRSGYFILSTFSSTHSNIGYIEKNTENI